MINSSNLDFAILNPSVTKYTYSIAFQTIASSPVAFTPTSYVTDTMRSSYGYSSTSKIVAIELKLLNVNFECPIASGLNIQSMVTLTHNATNFRRLGSGPYNMVAPMNRNIGSVTTVGSLISPVASFFVTLVPASYGSSNFTYTICNSNTGAAISTADYVMYNIELIEYVSQY